MVEGSFKVRQMSKISRLFTQSVFTDIFYVTATLQTVMTVIYCVSGGYRIDGNDCDMICGGN